MSSKNKFSFHFRFAEFFFVLLVLISSFTLAFNSGGFVLNFKKAGFTLITSVDKGVNYVFDGIKNTFNSVSELKRLRKEYNSLIIKLENYEEMQRSNADIKKENERLREQLEFSNTLDEKNIPAQIIARDIDSSFSYITIDKGSVNGIRKNMPVIAFQNGNNGLVGKVTQVGTFTSQIMPIYNINNIVSARIQNSRDLGLVNGLGSQEQPLRLQYIRKSLKDELQYGDVIVTSGENDNYMKDIPIGTISKVSVLDYNSSLDIEINSIIDFARLETVIVVNHKQLNDKKKVKEGDE